MASPRRWPLSKPLYRMRRTLDAPIPDGALPEGVTLVPFDESVARQCRALMNAVYGASEHETTASFELPLHSLVRL